MLRILVCVSGGGTNLQAIIDGIATGSITNTEIVRLDDIIGYDLQKKTLVENTKAFVEGKKANNVLLYGDSGTGKSTSIKAILNEFYDDGLRMIEIYNHQFHQLSALISKVKNRNYRFIIYMDDLSFEEWVALDVRYIKERSFVTDWKIIWKTFGAVFGMNGE